MTSQIMKEIIERRSREIQNGIKDDHNDNGGFKSISFRELMNSRKNGWTFLDSYGCHYYLGDQFVCNKDTRKKDIREYIRNEIEKLQYFIKGNKIKHLEAIRTRIPYFQDVHF